MAIPTEKDPQIENLLSAMLGKPQARITAIRTEVCIPAPIGCGNPIDGFRDKLSQREYSISGLCQRCQDTVFGGESD